MNALFIGRFQPLHNGHLAVINQYIDQYPVFYIGVGSSQYEDTLENPFSFQERKQMIQQALSDKQRSHVEIIPIPDIHNPPKWVDHVKKIIPDFDVVISNNSFTSELFKEKGYPIKNTLLFDRDNVSGKEIRRRMISDEPWKHLVPKEVAVYLNSINAVSRLKILQKNHDSV